MADVAQPQAQGEAAVDRPQSRRRGLTFKTWRQATGDEPGVHDPRADSHERCKARPGTTGAATPTAQEGIHRRPPQRADVVDGHTQERELA